jgi:hypothetical protein
MVFTLRTRLQDQALHDDTLNRGTAPNAAATIATNPSRWRLSPSMPCLQDTHRLATSTTPRCLWQCPCKEDGLPLSTAPPRHHGGAPVLEARSIQYRPPQHRGHGAPVLEARSIQYRPPQHRHRGSAEPSSAIKRREAPASPSRHQLVLRPSTAHHDHATGSTHGQAEPEAPNRSNRPPPLHLASRKPPPPSRSSDRSSRW